MNHTQLINYFIQKYNYKSYLEIGYWNGANFKKINVSEKIAVDPDPNTNPTHKMTSDEFFTENTRLFDIIFIDGLHYADQVIRDIHNSLKVLNDNGIILCHDLNPITEKMQIIPRPGPGPWTGDCWKAWVELRKTNTNLELKVIDTDWGIGIIKRNVEKPTPKLNIQKRLTYSNFEKYKVEWLNLISVESFLSSE